MADPYNSPEHFGLDIVGDIEWDDEPYQFDMTVVWRDKSGQLYMADDSGCSCPSPFETFNSVDDLTKVTPTELVRQLNERANNDWTRGQVAEVSTRVFNNEKFLK